jgi:hypothetical protein
MIYFVTWRFFFGFLYLFSSSGELGARSDQSRSRSKGSEKKQQGMASFFEDTFEVKNIDPEGKIFDKGAPSRSFI